jgi:DNA-binding HxlR family transcriptional regulator
MALFDLLGRRWALRVLWELRNDDALTFRELQARCGQISSSVLNERLRELREAGIVAGPPDSGYRLTELGQSLVRALGPIDAWSRRWARSSSLSSLPPDDKT